MVTPEEKRRMDIEMELHVPGLDLDQSRWTRHLIFMDEVHDKIYILGASAWEFYQAHGRGTLFVSKEKWMEVVRAAMAESQEFFPCDYIQIDGLPDGFDFAYFRGGFEAMVESYDPEEEFVLTVEHHPGGSLATYLIRTDKPLLELERQEEDVEIDAMKE